MAITIEQFVSDNVPRFIADDPTANEKYEADIAALFAAGYSAEDVQHGIDLLMAEIDSPTQPPNTPAALTNDAATTPAAQAIEAVHELPPGVCDENCCRPCQRILLAGGTPDSCSERNYHCVFFKAEV